MSIAIFRRGKHWYEATGKMRSGAYDKRDYFRKRGAEVDVRCTTAIYQCDRLPRWLLVSGLKPMNDEAKELKLAAKAAAMLAGVPQRQPNTKMTIDGSSLEQWLSK